MCSCSFYIKIIHLLSNVGISASHRLKPSSNSLNSIRDGTPLVPDPDETDDSTDNNGLDVSKQSIDGPVHSITNNGLDASKQSINGSIDSTTNNELDASKQNKDETVGNNGLDASRQNNDEPVGNNGLDVSKHNNGISPIDPSLGIL